MAGGHARNIYSCMQYVVGDFCGWQALMVGGRMLRVYVGRSLASGLNHLGLHLRFGGNMLYSESEVGFMFAVLKGLKGVNCPL